MGIPTDFLAVNAQSEQHNYHNNQIQIVCFDSHSPCSSIKDGWVGIAVKALLWPLVFVFSQDRRAALTANQVLPLFKTFSIFSWGWLSAKHIYLIQFVENINSVGINYVFIWVMHCGPCAWKDLKTQYKIRVWPLMLISAGILNELVQPCVTMLCDWFSDIIIKALKMINTLLFFYSQH